MRLLHRLLLVGVVLATPIVPRAADREPGERSVVRLQVITDAGEAYGACVLISRENRGAEVVLHFLTSSHLFRDAEGDRLAMHAIRLFLDERRSVDVAPADVIMPAGTLVDVAIVRVTTAATDLVPRPITLEAPPVGEVFLISGFDAHGKPATAGQRVRFRSSLLAVGDREPSSLTGCVGAPAISQRGVFGVVSECTSGRPPVVAVLAMAGSFLERYGGRAPVQTSLLPQFVFADRQVTGPIVMVACDAIRTGELEVPLELETQESPIDVSADFVNRREVRLAEVSVLDVRDRSVRVRFTLGGAPAPPSPPRVCPQGQALVSMRVNVAVARSPQ